MGNPFNVTQWVERARKKAEEDARRRAAGQQGNQPVAPGMPPKYSTPKASPVPAYVGNGRVPMTIKYGNSPVQGTQMKSFTAKSGTPLLGPDGQPIKQLKSFGTMEPLTLKGRETLPGGVIPKYTGPAWKLPAYGVKTPQDYRDKILSGQAFGAKPTGASQAPNTTGLTYEDEYGNIKYLDQLTPSPISLTPDQNRAWSNALSDYEDASDREARRQRETPGRGLRDVGDALGRSISNVIPWHLKCGNVLKNNMTGTGKFPALQGPPAPLDNVSAVAPIPDYTGNGYDDGGWPGGGGGGGGGGGYSPATKRWLNSLSSWRF